METKSNQVKQASKIKKGDKILDGDKVYTVIKKGKGYGDDEVKFTVNADEDLDPAFEKYFTYQREVLIELAE